MKIKWHGEESVSIKTSQVKVIFGLCEHNDKLTVGIDKESLLILPYKSDTYSDFIQNKVKKSECFVIDGAGEYSYKSTTIIVKMIKRLDNIKTNIVSMSINHILVAYLGSLDRELDGEEIGFVGNPDILFIPVGGSGVLNGNKANSLVNSIEPRVVVPINYQYEEFSAEKNPIDGFANEYGFKKDFLGEFVVKKAELPYDTTEVKLLSVEI